MCDRTNFIAFSLNMSTFLLTSSSSVFCAEVLVLFTCHGRGQSRGLQYQSHVAGALSALRIKLQPVHEDFFSRDAPIFKIFLSLLLRRETA